MHKSIPSRIACCICLAALIFVAAGSALAASVTINNWSFETPALADGAWNTSVTGWDKSGNGGTWDPNAPTYFPAGVPDGENVAWAHAGTISQVLTETVQANYRYKLDVYVGKSWGTDGYTIQLAARDALNVDHVLAQASGTAPSNSFSLVHLEYTSYSQYVGDRLKIILTSATSESDFDAVRLDAATPVPSSVLLLGSCLLGLGLLGLRRKGRT